MLEYKRLRKCSAEVQEPYWYGIALRNNKTGEIVEIPDADAWVLKSYASIVAVYQISTDTLYLLPRWNYSVTTQSHVRKFIEDYCRWSCPTREFMDEFSDAIFAPKDEALEWRNWRAW